jgi:hypothetical protein
VADMAVNSVIQDWSVRQYATSDGGRIDIQTTSRHHLLQIAIAEGIREMPSQPQHNYLVLKVSSSEYWWPVLSHSAYLTSAAQLFAIVPSWKSARWIVISGPNLGQLGSRFSNARMLCRSRAPFRIWKAEDYWLGSEQRSHEASAGNRCRRRA